MSSNICQPETLLAFVNGEDVDFSCTAYLYFAKLTICGQLWCPDGCSMLPVPCSNRMLFG